MCRVECSSFARFASPYNWVDALVMPSNRHCERSTGVVSVLVKVKSVPLPTTMSVRVPPLSMLIRRSMIVPFRLGERRAAGLGSAGGCSECPECGKYQQCDLSHIWTPLGSALTVRRERRGAGRSDPGGCNVHAVRPETCLTFGHPQRAPKRR